MNKVKKIFLGSLLLLAGASLCSAAIAYASTHTLQFVETPTIQLYQGESFNAACIIVTPVPEDLDGNVLTMSSFGSSPTLTVDPGISGLEEIEGFTSIVNNGNGTSQLCGLTRDLTSQYPYTTAGTGRAHAAGATVVFSNNPQMYARFAAYENTGTYTASQTFASTTFPGFDLDPGASYYTGGPNTTFVDYAELQRYFVTGCSNASTSVEGCVQLGTAAQVASSTVTGSTGANLVIPASMATSSDDVAGLHAVITQNSGKINWNQIDLGTSFTSTAADTFTAQTTFSGGTLTTASSTIAATSTATADTIGYNPQLNLIASTTITGFTLPQPVFVATSTGAIILSSANTYGASNFTGFAITNAVNGSTVVVQTGGVVKGFSGLTPGADYYVQNSAGTIGTSIPVPEIYVGTAVSATQILIQQRSMQYIGTGSVSGSPSTSTVPAFTRYVVVSGTVSSQNGATGGVSGTLGMNGGASNPSVTGGGFTCCTLSGLTYTVTWNTSGTYAGTVVSSKSVSGADTGSGSATLWYYR